ncbi:MAG: low molecular weight protein-tyrosine-phosphatase [cyanobacterium endosymbiont of Rhopalodia musculus]|uniref:low molecular weight protein-tyrosine-phosphatase n=1 Tax=cyanobacterium endosymbiont of Epithemia clementina EcSB TaxID=3034674 RepID=UPI0024814E25|nr:low molecular weight protein-tyrosine-phosphatase [cyanobacterium endosymbiont of Epithemia clementina EcSB]WGT68249.1 low molecular weight phosphotyrosine protein phosphatase [cyanobacterium endosymbiont of Epithemia clementina EcSB]
MVYRLLFVCLGNICRSPAAENIMNHLIKEADLEEQIICDSAGTSSYHIGTAPDRRMKSAVLSRGIEFRGRARQFDWFDFKQFDLILAMDQENYQNILALDSQGVYKNKVRLICEFMTKYPEKQILDPYYGGQAEFDKVIDLLLDACMGLLEEIRLNHLYS